MNPAMNPITEEDIANFLVHTPDFFERHAELLAAVRLNSPHGARAVSLQERQADMLREKIRALEIRLMDMMRHGTDNEVLIERMQRWVKTLLMTANARDLPYTIADHIQHDFMVPQVAIKVWGVAEDYQIEPFAVGVGDDIKTFAETLHTPYVGMNQNFEAVKWLLEPSACAVSCHGGLARYTGTRHAADGGEPAGYRFAGDGFTRRTALPRRYGNRIY